MIWTKQSKRLDWVTPALTIAAVLLAWQCVASALSLRLPPELALRFAPGSASVNARIAERALTEGDLRLAEDFAKRSLRAAPFSVRPLRVLGLVYDEQGRGAVADEAVTLAGNWSLRDDPAHAWLVERRLRQGNYTSAFAHADTLVRRRVDVAPQVFHFFSTAALTDNRALFALRDLLVLRPPWRNAFLEYLRPREHSDALELGLAFALADTAAPMNDMERQLMYQRWIEEGRLDAIQLARDKLDPAGAEALANGQFMNVSAHPIPFAWDLPTISGLSTEIAADPADEENTALRFLNVSPASTAVASQLITLAPGRYAVTGRAMSETADSGAPWRFTVTCINGPLIGDVSIAETSTEWTSFAGAFEVPSGCPMQWVRLLAEGSEGLAGSATWVDDIAIKRRV